MNASTREVLKGLADCMPESAVRVESSRDHDRLWLPKPVAADYQLYVCTFEGGGDASIEALPNGAPENAFFWHLPFEYSPDDEQGALVELVEESRRLILNRSRIILSGGFLLWRFRCEVEEGGKWKRVGGTVACIRLFFMPPFPFKLKKLEYHSAPLRSAF